MMSRKETPFRLPAEWEFDSTIMLAWPHKDTDWVDTLEDVVSCYKALVAAIVRERKVIIVAPEPNEVKSHLAHLPQEQIIYYKCPTNDTWTRDYGPITIVDQENNKRVLDFRFNGWGLKFASDCDNEVTRRMCRDYLITVPRINCQDFVLEGGGIESDGHGTLLTTARCQLSFNRNSTLDREQIIDRLKTYFGAEKVLWLTAGALAGDDTDSHIDTLARFAPDDTIVYTGCSDADDEHYESLAEMKRQLQVMTNIAGQPFNLIELPLPDPCFDDEGNRLPATYSNYLVTPTTVFMPEYGQPKKDLLAKQILEVAYSRAVVGIDCRALIYQHGSLHCATMQIPKDILAL